MEKATFAAGCFWAVESAFRKIPGVRSAIVGYTGGSTENPNYKEVCTGRTGHAEAVEVEFDPQLVTYNDLLEAFWDMHDPTTLNRQGPDIGAQYRSAVYFHDSKQEEVAKASKESLNASGKLPRPVVTEITAASTFWKAEEYHQRYHEKHGIEHC